MKRIVSWLLLGCMLIGLAGCGKDADEKVIRIGLLRIDDSVPFYVAEEEGLFAEYGVEVELCSFSSSSDQSVAMEAGELDMAMNDMIVQSLMKKNGTDTKIVQVAFGAEPKEGRFVVAAAPNSGIREPKDLIGKKVAISNHTMMDYLLTQFERIYGLESEEIETVNMPNLMLRVETLLEGKDIDAAILPDPLASYALSEGAVAVIDDTTLSENLSQSVVLATQEVLESDRDAVERVLQAYNEAERRINENPEKYREICLAKANVPETLKESYPVPQYTNWQLPSREEVKRIQDWMAARGLLENGYAYEDMVEDGFGE